MFHKWPEIVIVPEPSSSWGIWRWFTLSAPQDFVVFGQKKSKYVYFRNSKVKRLFIWLWQLGCKMLLYVQKTYSHLFRLRAQFTSLLRLKFKKADSFGSLQSKMRNELHRGLLVMCNNNMKLLSDEPFMCLFILFIHFLAFQLSAEITWLWHRAAPPAVKGAITRHPWWVSSEAQIKKKKKTNANFWRETHWHLNLSLSEPSLPSVPVVSYFSAI